MGKRAADVIARTRGNRSQEPRLLVVARRLKARYGYDADRPTVFDTEDRILTGPTSEPLDGLIETVLSQQSTVATTQRMANALRTAFPNWEPALAGGPEGIAVVLAAARGNLTVTKAQYIHGILSRLMSERKTLSLAFLRDHSAEEARRYLLSFRGVGPKTVNCVLLFNLRFPVQPVDTHLHRIALRLGLVGQDATPEVAGKAIEEVLPSTWQAHYEFHLNGIEHGQQSCVARSPRCSVCVVNDVCPSSSVGLGMAEEALDQDR